MASRQMLQRLRPMRSCGGLRSLAGKPSRRTPSSCPSSQIAAFHASCASRSPVQSSIAGKPPTKSAPPKQSTPKILDPQPAIPPAEAVRPGAAFEPVPEPPSQSPNGSGNGSGDVIDWSSSFHGLSTTPFSAETAALLQQPINADDVEIKPDGIIYLPEIKYRRILNAAFGPGGWGLAPRGELSVGEKVVTREYALIVHGRFIAQARGECQYFSEETIPTAGEGCKSNALLRCCKDLGIASELWDPRFIRDFKKAHCREVWVEHVATKKRRQIWLRNDCDPVYPYVIPVGTSTARAATSAAATTAAKAPFKKASSS